MATSDGNQQTPVRLETGGRVSGLTMGAFADTIAAVLDSARQAIPELSIAVSLGDQSGFGVGASKNILVVQAGLSDGQADLTFVTVKAAEFSEPKFGDRITVGDSIYFVTSCATDAVGGTRRIGLAPYYDLAAMITGRMKVDGAAVPISLDIHVRVLEPTLQDFTQNEFVSASQNQSIIVFRSVDWPYSFKPQTGFEIDVLGKAKFYIVNAVLNNGDWRCVCRELGGA